MKNFISHGWIAARALLLAAIAVPATAAADSGFYIGAAAGGATLEADIDEISIPGLPSSIDEDDTATEIFAGYEGTTRVLDLGCGTGIVARMLADRSFSVTGLDHSLDSLRQLQLRSTGIPLVSADAARLPFMQESFDAVVSLGAWRHFPDPEGVMADIKRTLKPGGIFLVGYFPPALGGLCPLRDNILGRLLARFYRVIMKLLGYADRADLELEQETINQAKACFGQVETITCEDTRRIIVARDSAPHG